MPQKKAKRKKTKVNEKRVKEREIKFVREKVCEWRKLHEVGDKLNLDQAANVIGISRKTLDDYFLQLRRADDLGFDFEDNKNKKMGVLRKFVKENSNSKFEKGRKSSTCSKTDDENQMTSSNPMDSEMSNNKLNFDVGDYICTEKIDS